MYGRSLQCLNSKIYARNAQSQPFNFQISGKSPYFQNSFFCLIEYISVSINATDAYYTSNDWKLSQLFAEPSRFELGGLHEELEALKEFSFFSPHPLMQKLPHIFVWVRQSPKHIWTKISPTFGFVLSYLLCCLETLSWLCFKASNSPYKFPIN